MSSQRLIQFVCIASYESVVASVRLDWRNGHFEISWVALGHQNEEPLHTKDWREASALFEQLVSEAQKYRAPLRLIAGGAL